MKKLKSLLMKIMQIPWVMKLIFKLYPLWIQFKAWLQSIWTRIKRAITAFVARLSKKR